MIKDKTPDYTAKFQTNLLFVLADVMELALMDCNESCRQIGKELRQEDKMHFNRAISEVRMIRRHLNKTSQKNQLDYGDAADEIYEMICRRAEE